VEPPRRHVRRAALDGVPRAHQRREQLLGDPAVRDVDQYPHPISVSEPRRPRLPARAIAGRPGRPLALSLDVADLAVTRCAEPLIRKTSTYTVLGFAGYGVASLLGAALFVAW